MHRGVVCDAGMGKRDLVCYESYAQAGNAKGTSRMNECPERFCRDTDSSSTPQTIVDLTPSLAGSSRHHSPRDAFVARSLFDHRGVLAQHLLMQVA